MNHLLVIKHSTEKRHSSPISITYLSFHIFLNLLFVISYMNAIQNTVRKNNVSSEKTNTHHTLTPLPLHSLVSMKEVN